MICGQKIKLSTELSTVFLSNINIFSQERIITGFEHVNNYQHIHSFVDMLSIICEYIGYKLICYVTKRAISFNSVISFNMDITFFL